MKHLLATTAAVCLAAGVMAANPAAAQNWGHGHNDRTSHYDHRDNGRSTYGRSNYSRNDNRGGSGYRGWHERTDWRRGGYVSRGDWDRGAVVDYRYHHGLYRPPYGYEWRRVDDRYVLVAVATGLIAAMLDGNY